MQSNNHDFVMPKTVKFLSTMKFLYQVERLKRIHQLIKRKATGTPQQLANKLALSERRVYQLLKLMKELDAPIYFDRERNSYCYKCEYHFSINFD